MISLLDDIGTGEICGGCSQAEGTGLSVAQAPSFENTFIIQAIDCSGRIISDGGAQFSLFFAFKDVDLTCKTSIIYLSTLSPISSILSKVYTDLPPLTIYVHTLPYHNLAFFNTAILDLKNGRYSVSYSTFAPLSTPSLEVSVMIVSGEETTHIVGSPFEVDLVSSSLCTDTNDCNGEGYCNNGQCICRTGFDSETSCDDGMLCYVILVPP